MKLIVTRPEADAQTLALKLEALGHWPILMPLLAIRPRPHIELPGRPWQAICFTSANGPRTYPATASLKNMRVLTVGPQSRAEAMKQGYANVQACGGDLTALAGHITAQLDPLAGPILYLTGADVSGDLDALLTKAGFQVHREIVYDAVPTVPAGLAHALHEAHGVLLYSPRTARLWVSVWENSALAATAQHLTHYCLSAAVAARLPTDFRKKTAPSPDESGMLSLLELR